MKLKCKRCKKVWDYTGKKGKKKYVEYTSCPICKTTVKVQELV